MNSITIKNKASYQDYVRAGRALLKEVRCYQVIIGYMATQVCTISHGGKVGRKLYTLTNYAEDIGVNRKTLSQWCSIYRVVIAKLDVDVNQVTSREWEIATRVHDLLKNEKRAINEAMGKERSKDKGWKLNAPAGKIKDMFQKYKEARPVEAEVHSWTDSAIVVKNKITSRDLSTVSVESLMSLKKALDGASENITNYLLDHRGVSIGELL